MAEFKKSTLVIVSAAILIIILGIAYFLLSNHLKKSKTTKAAATTVATLPVVKVTTLKSRVLAQMVSGYGSTVSPNTSLVASKTSGVIEGIYFKPGQPVVRGQLLFHIVSNDITQQMKQLKADVANTKYTYDSYMQANKEAPGSVSVVNLQKAKADYEGALSAYQAAKQEVFITAPIDGTASDTGLAVGNSVNVGDQLLSVYSIKGLQVKYTLPSQYSDLAQKGQKITFTPNDSKRKYDATVVYVSSELSAKNDNITLRANFDQPVTLAANLFGKVVQILNPNHTAIAVPQTLVQSDEQGFYLYSVDGSKVAKTYIKVGPVGSGGYVEIQSKWNSATQIITSDTSTLR